jgi:ribonuclease-3
MGASPLDAFDARYQLNFRDRRLLQQAFVHRSYLNEQSLNDSTLADNERLEFLGDSVLGFVVSDQLYRLFPEAREGDLTHLRTVLVRRETLAQLAGAMEIGSHLLLGVGEEESGGRMRSATLCAAFEALVGALFLDQGLDKVREFLAPQVEGILEQMQVSVMPKDPKSRFQEWAQHAYNYTPRYRVVEQFGPDHAKTFVTVVTVKNEPLGIGVGNSKQDASQAAAASALFRAGEPAPEFTPDPELEARFGLAAAVSPEPSA